MAYHKYHTYAESVETLPNEVPDISFWLTVVIIYSKSSKATEWANNASTF